RVGEARIALQLGTSDHLQQPLPVVVARARGVDEDVVVQPARPARIYVAGRGEPELALVPPALSRLAGEELAGKGDAAVIHDRLLHGHLDPLALAGAVA